MSGGSRSSICCLPGIYKQGAFRVGGGGGSAGVIHLNFGMVIIQGLSRPPSALIRSCQE